MKKYNTNYSDSGKISEWHEGNLKNIRLHQAQTIINICSVDPFHKFSFFGKENYGYKLWFEGIKILYREGSPKYSKNEIDVVDNIKKEIESIINLNLINESHIGSKKVIFIDNEKWLKLKDLIEKFERLVYFYNDVHGLSTMNREVDDGL